MLLHSLKDAKKLSKHKNYLNIICCLNISLMYGEYLYKNYLKKYEM